MEEHQRIKSLNISCARANQGDEPPFSTYFFLFIFRSFKSRAKKSRKSVWIQFFSWNLNLFLLQVLGTPTREQIKEMNPNYTEFKFPQIKAHPWQKVFRARTSPEAIDLVSRLLEYTPSARITPLQVSFLDDILAIKFIYSEKATKFCEISTLLLSTVHTDKR